LTIANVVHPSFLVAVSVNLAKSKLLVEDIGNLNALIEPFDYGLK
jgi:outer membrane murein-binding lipoprotein Lpp